MVTGSEAEVAVDISQLRAATGAITLDNGYGNTGSCKSAITFIDGERGILRYRGYPIEQLAESTSFVEVAYLLIYGHLPTVSELERFERDLTYHSLIHEDMKKFFEGYPPTAHPMAILSSMVTSLSSYYPGSAREVSVDLDIRGCCRRSAPSPRSRTRSRSASRSSTRATTSPTPRTSCT